MDPQVLNRMRSDWNDRAKENARFYVQTETREWDSREFFRSGEISVANEIMPDMPRITHGQASPLELRMLEIGCGVGRMTRMLSRIFGCVTAVDISEEMISQARRNLAGLENVELLVGDGATLQGLADASYDFAFSFIVFQHIPSYEVMSSYCREVYRVLKPGGLFKFQVQGYTGIPKDQVDTWVGYPISSRDAVTLSEESGFDIEREEGAGTQYYWLWFRKLAPST